jgi:hypothetical protein
MDTGENETMPLLAGDVICVNRKNRFYPPDVVIKLRTAGVKKMFSKHIATHCKIALYGGALEMSASGCTSSPEYTRKNERLVCAGNPGNIHPHSIIDDALILHVRTTGYAWAELLGDYLVGEWAKNMLSTPRKYYCSEYCREVYKRAGWKVPKKYRWRMSPYDWQKLIEREQ